MINAENFFRLVSLERLEHHAGKRKKETDRQRTRQDRQIEIS